MIELDIRQCRAEDVAAIAEHEPPGSSYAETTFAVEIQAKPAGAIGLAVGTDNPDARRLYERLGYLATGRFETYGYEFINTDGTPRSATETVEHLVKRLQ